MRKPAKFTGIVLLILFALAGFGLLSVNLYLRSPGVKARVAAAFHRATKLPCEFHSISYLPFQGLKLSALTIPQSSAAGDLVDAPFFHAEAVVAKLSLWSLIKRPLRINEIRCDRPTIISVQLDDGSVPLPWPSRPMVAPPEIAAYTPPTPNPEPLDVLTAAKPDNVTKVLAPQVPENLDEPESKVSPAAIDHPRVALEPTVAIDSPPPPVLVEKSVPELGKPSRASRPAVLWIKSARVQDGRFILLAADGKRSLIELNDIQTNLGFDQPWQRDGSLPQPEGGISIREVRVLQALRLEQLQSVIEVDNGQLVLPDIHAESDGGTVKGKLALGVAQRGLPFKAGLNFDGIGLREMIKRIGSRLEFSSGEVEGQVIAQGMLTAPATWRGAGRILGVNARVARNGLLEALGRHLGVQEFVQIAFDIAQTDFELRGPALVFKDIHLKTDNLEFKGLGVVAMNQRLQLRSRLYFSERMKLVLQRIERQLPERIKRNFDQLEGRDDYFRDFLINGTLANPRADFIGSEERTIEQMLELLQRQREDHSDKSTGPEAATTEE